MRRDLRMAGIAGTLEPGPCSSSPGATHLVSFPCPSPQPHAGSSQGPTSFKSIRPQAGGWRGESNFAGDPARRAGSKGGVSEPGGRGMSGACSPRARGVGIGPGLQSLQ